MQTRLLQFHRGSGAYHDNNIIIIIIVIIFMTACWVNNFVTIPINSVVNLSVYCTYTYLYVYILFVSFYKGVSTYWRNKKQNKHVIFCLICKSYLLYVYLFKLIWNNARVFENQYSLYTSEKSTNVVPQYLRFFDIQTSFLLLKYVHYTSVVIDI